MIFQVFFFTAAVVLIVMNVIEFNKYQESRKIRIQGIPRHQIRWFNFILTSVVAVGCALNIIIRWITKA